MKYCPIIGHIVRLSDNFRILDEKPGHRSARQDAAATQFRSREREQGRRAAIANATAACLSGPRSTRSRRELATVHSSGRRWAALGEEQRHAAPCAPRACLRDAARSDTAAIRSRDTPALGHRWVMALSGAPERTTLVTSIAGLSLQTTQCRLDRGWAPGPR